MIKCESFIWSMLVLNDGKLCFGLVFEIVLVSKVKKLFNFGLVV